MTEETRQWIIERELTHGFALKRGVEEGYLQNDSSQFTLPCGGTLLVVTTYSTELCDYQVYQSAFVISPTGEIEKVETPFPQQA